MSSLPLQRSKKKLQGEGWSVWVVEKWIAWPPPGHRVDMFNLIDLVAIKSTVKGVLGVQCCTDAGISPHAKKAMANPFLSIWKASGNRFVVWGWGKKGPLNKRKLWTLREVAL